MNIKLCAVLAPSLMLSGVALGQEQTTAEGPFFRNWTLDESIASEDYDFEGIVALSNCSGSLVRFESSEMGDAALVLTNGHCVSLLAPDEVIVDRSDRRDRRRFTILDTNAEELGRVRAQRLVYATMSRTDLALYELSETYEEIESEFGVRPLTLSAEEPEAGLEIEVVSGYWKRGYTCAIDRLVHELREGRWTFFDSIKYTDPNCQVIGGTSGSPVIARGTRTVVGVNNTGNESGRECEINNPCEVNENGDISFEEGWSYGQQTYWLYECLTEDLDLDLDQANCQLPQ